MTRSKSTCRKKLHSALSNQSLHHLMDPDLDYPETIRHKPYSFLARKSKNVSQRATDHLFYQSPKNPLATTDMEYLFNYANFQLLPEESKIELVQLLPSVDISDQPDIMDINPSFFTRTGNPVFWSVLDEWQAIIGTENKRENINPIEGPTIGVGSEVALGGSEVVVGASGVTVGGVRVGGGVAPEYKEEVFEQQWTEIQEKDKPINVAGDSKAITLKDMCRKGLIRKNDKLIYKRNFSACKVIVSKSMKVVEATGDTGISIELDGQHFKDFETPTALETKILDENGEVSKDRRPNGNAFKSIRLFRDGNDLGRLFDIRKDGFGDSA
ncbi:hypothetical protein J3Q64DRAFT_1722193 [Phycomyces blakesleeanus]|uniref:ASX DEUBAD domain-containing protein n=2 Tax=Phycomyces blakesleeanus TaxID=4837 RepID=A0A163E4Y8_PHYB8|nr:hypothetical protein PHYBLDRAFT_180179 [Phycomyces blakesleeanus NRRL 1555(-)]OAD76670.1 hypothetical protein PHYBLDRAFT_180179 [Phycomyces blakesleeanus NRRL 1555(-)]|eukprot:XP_018294710.1 hypothetical protein PHYBLDRAFT_180179 [Phycomyces blakesleeanus NRRL 1555(-)]